MVDDGPGHPVGGKATAAGGRGIFYDEKLAKQREDGEDRGIGVWVDLSLPDRPKIVRSLQAEGAHIISFHDDPDARLLILSPKSERIFNMYCHPSWLDKKMREMIEEAGEAAAPGLNMWKSKVILKSQWVAACIKLGEYLGEQENWGGLRAGGPPAFVRIRHQSPVLQPAVRIQRVLPLLPSVSQASGSLVEREPLVPAEAPKEAVSVGADEDAAAPVSDLPPPSATTSLDPVSAAIPAVPPSTNIEISGPDPSFSGQVLDENMDVDEDDNEYDESHVETSHQAAARSLETVFERITTPQPSSQPMPQSPANDGTPRSAFFHGLRFWVDLARPRRADLLRGIKKAGGSISTEQEEASHVLIHAYNPAKWAAVVPGLAKEGIWCLRATWAIDCIEAGRKLPEMDGHVPGGAPIDLGSQDPAAPTSVGSQNPKREWVAGSEPRFSPEVLRKAIARRAKAGMLDNIAAMIRDLNLEFGDVYSENHWRSVIQQWRTKTRRFAYLAGRDQEGELLSDSDTSNRADREAKQSPDSGDDGWRPARGRRIGQGAPHIENLSDAESGPSRSSSVDQIPPATSSMTTADLVVLFRWADRYKAQKRCTNVDVSELWCGKYPNAMPSTRHFRQTWRKYRRRLSRFAGVHPDRYTETLPLSPDGPSNADEDRSEDSSKSANDRKKDERAPRRHSTHEDIPAATKAMTTDDLAKIFAWATRLQQSKNTTYAEVARLWCKHNPGSLEDKTQFRPTWRQYRRREGKFQHIPPDPDAVRSDNEHGNPVASAPPSPRKSVETGSSAPAIPPDLPIEKVLHLLASVLKARSSGQKPLKVKPTAKRLQREYPHLGLNRLKWRRLIRYWRRVTASGKPFRTEDALQALQKHPANANSNVLADPKAKVPTSSTSKEPILPTARISDILEPYWLRVHTGALSRTELGSILAAKYGSYTPRSWLNLFNEFERGQGRFLDYGARATDVDRKRKRGSNTPVSPSKKLKSSPPFEAAPSVVTASQGSAGPSNTSGRGGYLWTREEEMAMARYIVERRPQSTEVSRPHWNAFAVQHTKRSLSAICEHFRLFQSRIYTLVDLLDNPDRADTTEKQVKAASQTGGHSAQDAIVISDGSDSDVSWGEEDDIVEITSDSGSVGSASG